MGVYIFHLIRPLLILTFVNLLALAPRVLGSEKGCSDQTSYFPLLAGSYWIWQDSFFVKEDYITALEGTNGEAAILICKDSVVSVAENDSGCMIKIFRNQFYKEGRKLPASNETYFVDHYGIVRIETGTPIAKLKPKSGDSLIARNRLAVVFEESDSVQKEFKAIYKRHGETAFFQKGIGKVGSCTKTTASNLIEYRIGAGPIIKKHWLMESPKPSK